MNNWLGFSLSPHHQHQNHHQQQQQKQLPFTSDAPAECFDLMPPHSSSIPSFLHPETAPPFGLVQAFDRNTTAAPHPQDVNISSYSCSNQETPKLENFLGHSFSDSNHQEPNKQQIQSHPIASSTDYNYNYPNTTSTTTMGLSMIKNWLRNNPPTATDTGATEAAVAPATVPTMPPGVQTLSLSMSTGSSGCTKLQQCGSVGAAAPTTDTSQSGGATENLPRKSIDTFGQRTSIYRGVTRHRWTGRYEAHLWDNSCRREGQTRKGRQVYLGGYDKEEKAARAYDLAALKYWGTTTTTNFPISNYDKDIEEMKHMTRQEYVASLRRKSSGFSRGASIYRGVTRHHQHGRWQARIGRVAGNKDLYLGTFSTQEEAAEAYDIAAIKFRGLNAVTNFEISRYDVKSIMESTTLPIGGAAKRLKDTETAAENMQGLELHRIVDEAGNTLNLHATDQEAHLNGYGAHPHAQHGWPSNSIAFQQVHGVANMYPYGRLWCKQEQDSESTGFNDHQLGGNTQNLPLHNLMSLDSCPNPSVAAGVYDSNGTINGTGSCFGLPLGMMTNQEGVSNEDGGMFGTGDAYQQHQQARNLYYNQETSNNGMALPRVYNDHQGSLCNNWIPTGVPTLASSRGNAMAICHGTSTNFTVWNDT